MGRFLGKFLLNGIVVVPLLMWFTEATFLSSVVAALVLSVISYVLGDMMVLRFSNNTVATIGDAVLAFIYFWVVSYFMNWSLSFGELVTMVVALAIVEFIFHRILGRTDGRRDPAST